MRYNQKLGGKHHEQKTVVQNMKMINKNLIYYKISTNIFYKNILL